MPVPQRRSAIALLIAFILCTACEASLASDLDEAQADEVVLALDRAGIGARKERAETPGESASFAVIVARDDIAPALAVLRAQELPRRRAAGFDRLFAERGLVPNASDERARYGAAVAGELSRSLEAFDGVARARVHVALPDNGARLLDTQAPRPRASVLIEHRRGAHIDANAVRALVAGAVSDMRAEDVAVVLTPMGSRERHARHLAQIGPIAVSQGSAGLLKAILAGSFALNLILAGALVLARMRRRSANREPALHVRETRSSG
jgi:type III secretion protein J